MNPRYAGLRSLHGEIVAAGQWPAIVPEETWRAVVAHLEDPARRTTPDTRRRYLLSGLAFCRCGAHVTTGANYHGTRVYRCSKTAHLSRAAAPVDAFIEAVVIQRLSRPDIVALLTAPRDRGTAKLRGEAQALRKRRDQLAEAFADQDVSLSQLTAGTKRLDERLGEIESQLAVAVSADVLAGAAGPDAEASWAGLDLERRRAVIDALATITLLPTGRGHRRFDPETVQIDWRTA